MLCYHEILKEISLERSNKCLDGKVFKCVDQGVVASIEISPLEKLCYGAYRQVI